MQEDTDTLVGINAADIVKLKNSGYYTVAVYHYLSYGELTGKD